MFTPRTCTRGKAINCVIVVIVVVVVVVVSTKITISRDVGIQGTRKHSQSNSAKNWLQCTSNQGIWSTIVRNGAFMLAIVAAPIDSAYSMHNACHCFAQLSAKYSMTGKDRRN